MLESRHIATFAAMTNRCLVVHRDRGFFGPRQSCRHQNQPSGESKVVTVNLLHTLVRPRAEAERSIREDWNLRLGNTYFFEPTKLKRVACSLYMDTLIHRVTGRRKKFLCALDRDIPLPFRGAIISRLRRLHYQVDDRREEEEQLEEHDGRAEQPDDGEQRVGNWRPDEVAICPLKQWLIQIGAWYDT